MRTLQISLGLFAGAAAVLAFFRIVRQESNLNTEGITPGRKAVLTEPFALVVMILVILFFSLIIPAVFREIVIMFAMLFVYISVYYAALLLLLPLLRRLISARACAVMWIVPAMLYCAVRIIQYFDSPIFIIILPREWLSIFIWVWLVGFVCVSVWQVLSHFHYRGFLKKNSVEITDGDTLSLWHNYSFKHGVKREIPVYVSDAVSTPLTIGCFERTMRLYLPKLSYSDEELALIFQHELRHILRLDTRMKAFMDFFAALSWFNPLAWIARRKASDDLELSCDEAVLSGADEGKRRLYAELLLKNAGKNQGYSTCLSVSAKSMRYRLKNIMKPSKWLSGGFVVGAAMFGLFMIIGTVAFEDSVGNVQELVFEKAPAGITEDSVAVYNWDDLPRYRTVYEWETDTLTEYLASLRVKQVYTANSILKHYDDSSRQLYVDYLELIDGEWASLTRFELRSDVMYASIPYDNQGYIKFILESEPDWDYIESLLDFDAPNPDPAPFPPDMMLYFCESINPRGELIYAARNILYVHGEGEEQQVNENLNRTGDGGVSGVPVTQVKLSFSYEPSDGYTVRVENWDRTESYTVSSEDLNDDVLPLAPYDAHYTVYGTFSTVRNTTYGMEFYFDIQLP